MSEVNVDLGERSYCITIGPGVLSKLGEVVTKIMQPTQVAVISNPVIAKHFGQQAINSLQSSGISAQLVIVPAGERYKTLNTIQKIYDNLLAMNMDRKGMIVALGGGVIGDMAGFAAATYMRGIDFIQVPTTLLAQVDASIGGKTGVDLPQGKNLVGAFHQPRAVVIDTHTLNTLPIRELRSGLAEVVKHGIIYDHEFLGFLGLHANDMLARSLDVLEVAIKRSVEIKRDVVQKDERESGLRAILNYGHTVAHAIEVLSGYGKYRHGEASSIGMVTEALLAEMNGFAEKGIVSVIATTLAKMRLPVEMDNSLSTDDMIRAIEHDKKTIGGEIRLAMPTKLGECAIFKVTREMMAEAIDAHREWSR